MVEFPQDIWSKIKTYQPKPCAIDVSKPFIIKDVVLTHIRTDGRFSWFIVQDDIIHSDTIKLYIIFNPLIKISDNLFSQVLLISIKYVDVSKFKLENNELYKCNILIHKVFDYRSVTGYKHVAELKYCKPLKQHNDELNKSVFIDTNTHNNNDILEIKKHHEVNDMK